jgi:hypothetical protein
LRPAAGALFARFNEYKFIPMCCDEDALAARMKAGAGWLLLTTFRFDDCWCDADENTRE